MHAVACVVCVDSVLLWTSTEASSTLVLLIVKLAFSLLQPLLLSYVYVTGGVCVQVWSVAVFVDDKCHTTDLTSWIKWCLWMGVIQQVHR